MSSVSINCQTIKVGCFILFGILLVGCQSQSGQNKVSQASAGTEQRLLIQQPQNMTVMLVNSRWKIVTVEQRTARAFHTQPYLYLLRGNELVGSTGCNALSGRYQLAGAGKVLFDVKAGHQHCHNALAQEAELVDAFARVRQYKLDKQRLYLQDERGQTLIEAIGQ